MIKTRSRRELKQCRSHSKGEKYCPPFTCQQQIIVRSHYCPLLLLKLPFQQMVPVNGLIHVAPSIDDAYFTNMYKRLVLGCTELLLTSK